MRILLPVRVQADGWLGGANYFMSLVSAMRGRRRDDVELVVASNQPAVFGAPGDQGVRVVAADWLDTRSSWRSRVNGALATLGPCNPRLQALAASLGSDVVSHVVPSPSSVCPMLFWMPDFQHCLYPEFFSPAECRRRDRSISATRRTGHILLSSESAASDFRRYFPGLSAVRTHVLRFTPLIQELPSPEGESVARRLGLRSGFFFLPNQYWRHKNHAVVIEALRQLPDSIQVATTGSISDYRGGAHIAEMLVNIERHGLGERFRLLGILPRAEMMQLMSEASAVINPSLFEGWSTTVEEAKASGKRLILSDIPVHREQDPIDAIYFPAHDAATLAEAMLRVQSDFQPEREAARKQVALENHGRQVSAFAQRYIEIARIVASRQAPGDGGERA